MQEIRVSELLKLLDAQRAEYVVQLCSPGRTAQEYDNDRGAVNYIDRLKLRIQHLNDRA